MAGKAPRITVYTTSQCTHCKQLKRWLQDQNFRFQEFDIQKNQRAFKEFSKLGARGVPVTLINGERIDDFDVKRFSKLLKHG